MKAERMHSNLDRNGITTYTTLTPCLSYLYLDLENARRAVSR